MAKAKQMLRLFVASSMDVGSERKKIRAIVNEINRQPSRENLHIELVLWEDRPPALNERGPQEVINPDLDTADIVIFLVWNRFGKGVEEEANRTLERWKRTRKPHVMVYFCRTASNLDTLEQLEHRGRVIDFRERIQNLGLFRDYMNLKEFGKFIKQDVFGMTRDWDNHGFRDHVGDATKLRELIHVGARRNVSQPPKWLVGLDGCPHGGSREKAEPWVEKYANESGPQIILVLGESGSGKTMLLRRLVHEWTNSPQPKSVVIPVMDINECWWRKGVNVFSAIGEEISYLTGKNWSNGVIEELLTQYHVIFCFDGYDEVAPPQDEVRTQSLTERLIILANLKCTVVVASREEHYEPNEVGVQGPLAEFRRYHPTGLRRLRLQPLTDEQRDMIIRNYAKEVGDCDAADYKKFLQRLEQQGESEAFLRSPFWLGTLLNVFLDERDRLNMPSGRDPFREIITRIVEIDARRVGMTPADLENILEACAWRDFCKVGQQGTPVSLKDKDNVPHVSSGCAAQLRKVRLVKQVTPQKDHVGEVTFRHQIYRDHFLAAFAQAKMDKGSVELIGDRMLVRNISVFLRGSLTDLTVEHIENALLKMSPDPPSLLERNAWHLVFVYAWHHQMRLNDDLVQVASLRLRRHFNYIRDESTADHELLSAVASAREISLLLCLRQQEQLGAIRDEYIATIRTSERAGNAFVKLAVEYFGTAFAAVKRVVEHLLDSSYAVMDIFDVLELILLFQKSRKTADFARQVASLEIDLGKLEEELSGRGHKSAQLPVLFNDLRSALEPILEQCPVHGG